MKKNLILFGLLAISASAQSFTPLFPVPSSLVEPSVDAARKTFPKDKGKRLVFIDAYCEAILDHLRHGDKIEIYRHKHRPDDEAWNAGRQAGIADYSNLAKSGIHVTPMDFDYTVKTLSGVYHLGVYSSDFFILKGTNERLEIFWAGAEPVTNGSEATLLAYVGPEREPRHEHAFYRRSMIVISRKENEPNPESCVVAKPTTRLLLNKPD